MFNHIFKAKEKKIFISFRKKIFFFLSKLKLGELMVGGMVELRPAKKLI